MCVMKVKIYANNEIEAEVNNVEDIVLLKQFLSEKPLQSASKPQEPKPPEPPMQQETKSQIPKAPKPPYHIDNILANLPVVFTIRDLYKAIFNKEAPRSIVTDDYNGYIRVRTILDRLIFKKRVKQFGTKKKRYINLIHYKAPHQQNQINIDLSKLPKLVSIRHIYKQMFDVGNKKLGNIKVKDPNGYNVVKNIINKLIDEKKLIPLGYKKRYWLNTLSSIPDIIEYKLDSKSDSDEQDAYTSWLKNEIIPKLPDKFNNYDVFKAVYGYYPEKLQSDMNRKKYMRIYFYLYKLVKSGYLNKEIINGKAYYNLLTANNVAN